MGMYLKDRVHRRGLSSALVALVLLAVAGVQQVFAQGDGAVVVRVGDGSIVTVPPAFSDTFQRDFTLPVDVDFGSATGLDVGDLSVAVMWNPNEVEFVGFIPGTQGIVTVDDAQVSAGRLDLRVTSTSGLNATFTLANVTFRATFQGGPDPSPPTFALIDLLLLNALSGAGADIGQDVALFPLNLCACGGRNGDVTGDGVINTFDWIDVARFAFNGSPPLSGTSEGVQNYGDVTEPIGTFNTFDWIDIARVGFGFEPLNPELSVAGSFSTTRSIPQAPDDLAFSMQPSDVQVDEEIPPVIVTVVDENGDLVSDFDGQMTVTLNQIAGSGMLGGVRVVDLINGIGAFGSLSVTEQGTYSLTAEVGSASATSNSFIVAGSRALTVLQQPLNVAVGEQLTPGPGAELKTPQQNPVRGVDVTIEITGDPPGVGLAGELVQPTDATGRVSFSDLRIDTPGLYTFTLSTATESVQTEEFLVTDGLPVTRIGWVQMPTDVVENGLMLPAPSVLLQSQLGPFAGVPVSLELTDPQGASLSVTEPLPTNVSGRVSFDDVRVDTPGTYTLTAVAGSEREESFTFTVSSTQDSGNALLEGLSLSNPDTNLDQPFDPDLTMYSATVVPGTRSVTVFADPAVELATVEIDGVVVGGSGSREVSLTLSDVTSIDVKVTALDGTVRTYSIDVDRPASDNPMLGSILLNGGSIELEPEFEADVFTYGVEVTAESIGVSALPLVGDATYTVNSEDPPPNSPSGVQVVTPAGETTEVVVVGRSEDGQNMEEYRIRVVRAENNADLASLTLEDPTVPFTFFPDVIRYTAVLSDGTETSIAVRATTANPAATIEVDGAEVPNGAPQTIQLNEDGRTDISVVVTAPDGVTKKEYRIEVFRPSGNTTLGMISLLQPDTNLSPDFSPGTRDYEATVESGSTSVDVRIVRGDDRQRVTINGSPPVASGTSVPLPTVGDHPVAIEVTAPDGVTTDTYSIVITRPANDDATLNTLELLSPATPLSREFSPDHFDYGATVPFVNRSVLIRAVPTDPGARVDILADGDSEETGELVIPLTAGENHLIPILVTAMDGQTFETYTVDIRRPGNGAALWEITVEAPQAGQGILGFDQPFDPTLPILTTADPLPGTNTVTIRARQFNPAAQLTIEGQEVDDGQTLDLPLLVGASNRIQLVVTDPSDGVRQYIVVVDNPTVSYQVLPERVTMFRVGDELPFTASLVDELGDPAPIQPTSFRFGSSGPGSNLSVDPVSGVATLTGTTASTAAVTASSAELSGPNLNQGQAEVRIFRSLSIAPDTGDDIRLHPGGSIQFDIVDTEFPIAPLGQRPPITWVSSNPSLLQVDPTSGLATASLENTGIVTVRAEAFGVQSPPTQITVGPVVVDDIQIVAGPRTGPLSLSLQTTNGVFAEVVAVESASIARGVPFAWATSDPSVVRVIRAFPIDTDPEMASVNIVAVGSGNAVVSLTAGGHTVSELYTISVQGQVPAVDDIQMRWGRFLTSPPSMVPVGATQDLTVDIREVSGRLFTHGADVVLEVVSSSPGGVLRIVRSPFENDFIQARVEALAAGCAVIVARSLSSNATSNPILVNVYDGSGNGGGSCQVPDP